jgi:hypothetical protein
VDEEMALLQVQRGREADKLIAMVRSPLLSASQPLRSLSVFSRPRIATNWK